VQHGCKAVVEECNSPPLRVQQKWKKSAIVSKNISKKFELSKKTCNMGAKQLLRSVTVLSIKSSTKMEEECYSQ